MGLEEQRRLDESYVMGTFARKDVCLVRGDGMTVVDDAGASYLDFIAGIGVCSLGHCHPRVVEAIKSQADALIHVSNYYYIEHRGQVAQMLSDLLNAASDADAEPEPWQSFFANSGAEANECAIKLARLWSKRHGNGGITVIALEGSFHGRTMQTLAATGQPVKQDAFAPMPEKFVHVPINDGDALRAAFDAHAGTVSAVMLEVVQGESGVHPCTGDFLQLASRLCRENGALLICDEVQTGIYRTGAPFAFQHFGIQPDIVTIAKGVASGFPTGACAARASVAQVMEPGLHGSTFGGSNLAMAAARATLCALAEEGVADNVQRVGAYLQQRLAALPGVVEVRGAGLMVAADLDDGYEAGAIVSRALDAGLLLNATGPHTLRFLPPLVCTTAHVDELADKLAALLA